MSISEQLYQLHLINFLFGFVMDCSISICSFLCILTYPKLGAVASGIGISGYVLAAFFWNLISYYVINPYGKNPEIDKDISNGNYSTIEYKYYDSEISRNVPSLFFCAAIFTALMLVLMQLFMSEPESTTSHIAEMVSSILSGD